MVKLLCMDVDGTLTDGRVYISPRGEELKAFDVKDGYGICHILPKLGILPVVMTGRSSEALVRRCTELGITELYQGVSDKVSCLDDLMSKMGVDWSQVAYIGDDLNDLVCMERVAASGGVVGCPMDACREVATASNFVATRLGGRGAVREFIDWLYMSFDE